MDNLVTFTNAANKTTNYTYDLEGNLTSIKDPAGRTEKFDYDEKGRLTGHTQASGKKTTYDYDKPVSYTHLDVYKRQCRNSRKV